MTPPPFREGDVVLLTPERLGKRGEAEASYEGWRVRVRGGIPGESARVRIVHVSRGGPVAEGRFLEPSGAPHSGRRPAPCPVHDSCGGCGLQHIDAVSALEEKITEARRLLSEAGVVEAPFEEPIRSLRAFGYRAKTFLLPQPSEGRTRFGARPPRGERLIDTRGCLVLIPRLEGLCAVARGVLERVAPDSLRSVMLRCNRRGETELTLVHRGEDVGGRLALLGEEIARRGRTSAVFLQRHDAPGNRICSDAREELCCGAGILVESFGPLSAAVPPTAFFQANPDVAEALYRRIAERLEGACVTELYCGGGVAGLLALRTGAAGRLVASDLSPRAVAAAQENATRNGLSERCRFRVGAAREEPIEGEAVLVNPPRAGCRSEVLRAIGESRARRALYLSCSARTLARDLAALAEHGFRVNSLTPADMLPQTPHLELLAELNRAGASAPPAD